MMWGSLSFISRVVVTKRKEKANDCSYVRILCQPSAVSMAFFLSFSFFLAAGFNLRGFSPGTRIYPRPTSSHRRVDVTFPPFLVTPNESQEAPLIKDESTDDDKDHKRRNKELLRNKFVAYEELKKERGEEKICRSHRHSFFLD